MKNVCAGFYSGSQAQAIALCVLIETFAPDCGCHVALTGGTLYKLGERKDIDILFYRIRQVDQIDYDLLFSKLAAIGFEIIESHGWVTKASWQGISVDLFFPESQGAPGDEGEDYGG